MTETTVPVGDSRAVKRFSGALAHDVVKSAYWTSKMMAPGFESRKPVMVMNDLVNAAGDNITFDLAAQLKQEPIYGDAKAEGKEEALSMYTDNIYIDQVRCPVSGGGRMSQQRTLHNLRQVARVKTADWWQRYVDEVIDCYAAGARGVTTDFIVGTGFTGFAGNAFSAPDTAHQSYAGAATSKASLVAGDKLSLTTIDKIKAKATTMGGGTDGVPSMVPINVDGMETYVLKLHPWSEYDLRQNANTGQWADIQKALVTSQGANSPLFKGGLGLYNGIVLHSHRNTIRFSDYGAGSNVAASRNLFLGSQALCVAFGGGSSGFRFKWWEGMADGDNQVIIHTSCIFGVKKTNFNVKGTPYDFGVIAVDSACANPG